MVSFLANLNPLFSSQVNHSSKYICMFLLWAIGWDLINGYWSRGYTYEWHECNLWGAKFNFVEAKQNKTNSGIRYGFDNFTCSSIDDKV